MKESFRLFSALLLGCILCGGVAQKIVGTAQAQEAEPVSAPQLAIPPIVTPPINTPPLNPLPHATLSPHAVEPNRLHDVQHCHDGDRHCHNRHRRYHKKEAAKKPAAPGLNPGGETTPFNPAGEKTQYNQTGGVNAASPSPPPSAPVPARSGVAK